MMVIFCAGINKTVMDLIRKLLNPNAGLRLGQLKGGEEDIKNHKWFRGIGWDRLEGKLYKAPWKPTVRTSF